MLNKKFRKHRYILIKTKDVKQTKQKLNEMCGLKYNQIELADTIFHFKKINYLHYILKVDLKIYTVVRGILLVLNYYDVATAIITSGCISKLYKYTKFRK